MAGLPPHARLRRAADFAALRNARGRLQTKHFLLRWIDKREFLAFDPRSASWVAFAISSALFASEHSQWFAGLLAGMTYNWIYMRTGNLWVPIVSHATTNGLLGIWILATGNWQFW